MSKYFRHQSVISTNNSDEASGDYWLKQFESSLQKSAVQPREVDKSLFDQINNIMNNTHSKYPSVEAAVEDMKERSGLTAYLNKMNKLSVPELSNKTKKTANNKNEPLVIQQCPQIKNTIQNYIRDTKGNLPIPAIIDKIMSIHRNDVSNDADWDDENLLRLVSQLNLNAKKNNPTNYNQFNNLGTNTDSNNIEIDNSNVDAFDFANPVKF